VSVGGGGVWVGDCVGACVVACIGGADCGVHFQGTATVLPPCTVKMNDPLVQLLAGIVIPTCFDPPGLSVPPVGLKFTPAISGVLADQFRLPDELESSDNVILHVQTLLLLSYTHVFVSVLSIGDGLTISVGGVVGGCVGD